MQSRKLEQILQFNKIILYGIGNQFKECYKIFKHKDIVLVDGNPQKWGSIVEGHTIYAPKDISQFIDDKTAVVVTSINNQYEIARMLVDEVGVHSENIFMYTSSWYEDNVFIPDIIVENWNRVETCCSRLADEDSKKYYINSLYGRLQRNPLFLQPNPNCKVIGEYANKVQLNQGECIIDCGAYTGDTAEMYMKRLVGNCSVYAIEPYEENYNMLTQRILDNNWGERVQAFNCAVGDTVRESIISYNSGDFGMAINLSNSIGTEQQKIKIETLDHLLGDCPVSYIKMDIEGEEVAALRGAIKIIQKRCPKLMISGYHKISDFWEIPETIWAINNDYKIYVGHAPGVSTEIEFYCVH